MAPRYGSHLSVAGGIHNALLEAGRLGMASVQVFTRNQRQWNAPPVLPEEIEQFRAARASSGLQGAGAVVSHNSYLVNLASPDADKRTQSINAQRAELERCEALGIDTCVLHPGAHLGTPRTPRDPNRLGEAPSPDEAAGLDRICASITALLRQTRGARVRMCIETTTGSGTNLGYDFAHLARIRDGVTEPERLGVCIDTCHVVAAGYDMSTPQGAATVLEQFDAVVGLCHVGAVHMNDSEGALGSRLDRHAHIGKGCCGDACFAAVLTHPTLAGVPVILETPKDERPDGKAWDTVNIRALERIRTRALAALACLMLVATACPGLACASRKAPGTAGGGQRSAGPAATASQPSPAEQVLLNDGARAVEQGRLDEALAQFTAILARNPRLPEAFVGIGDVRFAQGRWGEAEPNYRRAATLDPEDFRAQFGLGRSLQMLGRVRDAIAAYHRALVVAPDSAEAHRNMATAFLSLGDATAAAQFGEKAVALDPANGPAHVNLGVAYERLGRPDDAIAQYQAAAETMPATPQLLLNLVNASVSAGRLEEAVATAQTLTRMSARPESFERLGWALFRASRFGEAGAAYRQAVTLDPTYWPAWNGIGVISLNAWIVSEKRDTEAGREARRAFRASLRAQPDQPKIVKLFTTYGL